MTRKAIILLSVVLALMTAVIDLVSRGRTLYCAKPRSGDPWEIKFTDGYQYRWRGLTFRDGSLRLFCEPKYPPSPAVALVDRRWDGFEMFLTPHGGGEMEFLLRLPLWLPLVLFALYPTIAFVRGPLRRHRRRKKGLCVKCGYDLTGNMTGICSECGEKI